MTTSASQQTELEKPVTRIAYFVKFDLKSAPVYVSSLGQTYVWGGFTWIGLGALGNISSVNEELGTAASSLTFTLNIVQASWLSLAVGDVQEYRGRDATMYFCPMDEQFRLIDTPITCWRGTMDVMTAGVSGGQGESTGSIALKCETSAYGLRRRVPLRLNAANQKQKYPSDTGLDYLTELISNPDATVWLSAKFQS